MSEKIPFVISEAYPDYKRPWVNQIFGTCYKSEIPSYFINKVAEFIFERSNQDAINDIEGIQDFWNQYYSEYYIGNSPWEATVFIDNKWVSITPSNEEILERVKKLILWEAENIERDCDRQAELSDDEIEEEKNPDFYDLLEEEQIVIDKMKEYFEKEGFCNILQNQDKTEQAINFLNKFIIKTDNNVFEQNKELFTSFTNILLKCIEKDIEKITSEMEVIHTEENSKKLAQIMDIYGSLLEYKNHFKI